MAQHHCWLARQNQLRAAARRAAGALALAPRVGGGRARARARWAARRSRERQLVRLRATRRPFVQGKRRLWGKGPAPLHYQEAASQMVYSPIPSNIADCGSPLTPPRPEASLAPAEVAAGSLTQSWEPLDMPMLAILESSLQEDLTRTRAVSERCAFAFLARAMGVRV